MITRAIFPGTFDPVHFGHLDVLQQALELFDQVIWAVGSNPDKLPRFATSTRLEMMQLVRPSLTVVSFSGLLISAARQYQCTHIVRSLRAGIDFDYEFPMTLVNKRLAPEITTVYFPAKQEHFHISSSMVRQLYAMGQDLSAYVPREVLRFLK